MNKIGLALSGGGFRASLYHLGLVRFLRDAGILPKVTHITSVSGGSIFSAHLVLNWDRYNGSDNEFDAVASEFLNIVRLDVRGRILRRFPLTIPLGWPLRLMAKSRRKLSRTGLLEYHYQRYLYGDTTLFELPKKPQLHLLTTNLSEGCICSFNRDGLLMVRRQPDGTFRRDRIKTGLATVPMAVTASSAFPGFFPPIELTAADVGALGGDFVRQAYTDGGIFDNLGVRMFRFLDRQILAEEQIARDDFFDIGAAFRALRDAGTSTMETPLRRVAQVLEQAGKSSEETPLHLLAVAIEKTMNPPGQGVESEAPTPEAAERTGADDHIELILSRLWEVMCHYQFQHEPTFTGLELSDTSAVALLQASRVGAQKLDTGDQVWLNRHLLEAAFRQATGQPCFRRLNSGLDMVIVSDVGKPMAVKGSHAGGLIRTALRASDILMDRVWQLENENFQDTTGFIFAPITAVVEQSEDPTALHPELQRHAANIRTDLDRFSMLEISCLIRHGYCMGRKVCRSRPALFGNKLPDNPPWDPVPEPLGAVPSHQAAARLGMVRGEPSATTLQTRTLQESSYRRIFSTLLDYRDWVTYIYVPLLVPFLVLMPYLVVKNYQRSQLDSRLIQAFTQGNQDLAQLNRLLANGPDERWAGVTAQVVNGLGQPDFTGYQVLQDSNFVDLRLWRRGDTSDSKAHISFYRRLRVLKEPGNTKNLIFRVPLRLNLCAVQVRFPSQELQPRLLKGAEQRSPTGQEQCEWQISYDFKKVLPRTPVDLMWEYQYPFTPGEIPATHAYSVDVETHELTNWILMPEGHFYKDFSSIRYQQGRPDTAEPLRFDTQYMPNDASVLAYKVVGLHPGYVHETSWSYR